MAFAAPKWSIYFHPEQPVPFYKIEMMRNLAGWDLAETPEEADWRFLHWDDTFVDLPDSDAWSNTSAGWINGHCRDISKRTIQRIFEAIFGYPLAIDPLTHQGVCLRKSNRNYVKDAVVVDCPVPAAEIDEQSVYERLVDSRADELGIVELCPSVVGGAVVSVRRWIRPDWFHSRQLSTVILDETVVIPGSVFSHRELEQLSAFCTAIGLDFGELNVMRDREDGRIYIIDANNTPSYDFERVWGIEELEQITLAFTEHFPPRSSVQGSAPAAPDFHRAAQSPGLNGHGAMPAGVATRFDVQSGRIARLESVVGELTVSIERLRAAQDSAPSRPGKKKRKR